MKRLVQGLVGLAVSAAALWLTFRGKDLAGVWEAMRTANYAWLVPFFAITSAIHFARAKRWGILLEPVAKIPFNRLNAVSAVGFMALAILPFRLGEFARPYLIAERPKLRVSAALSSVVVERVADGIFTGLLLVISLLAVPDGAPGVALLRTAGVVVSLAFAGLLVFLVIGYRNRALAIRVVERLVGAVSRKAAGRVAGMIDAFIHGLRIVPSRRKIGVFFALTAAYWGMNALGMAMLARAFGIALGPLEAVTVLGVLVVGVMIPAGPGMVGTFQGAVVLGLSLFLDRERLATDGAAYANVLWAAQMVQIAAFGLLFLFSRHIRIARIFEAPGEVGAGLEDEEREYQAAEPRGPGSAAAGG